MTEKQKCLQQGSRLLCEELGLTELLKSMDDKGEEETWNYVNNVLKLFNKTPKGHVFLVEKLAKPETRQLFIDSCKLCMHILDDDNGFEFYGDYTKLVNGQSWNEFKEQHELMKHNKIKYSTGEITKSGYSYYL